jgi:hypothetical protein
VSLEDGKEAPHVFLLAKFLCYVLTDYRKIVRRQKMKRLLFIFVMGALIPAGTYTAKAANLTFEFTANDLIDLYNTDFSGSKATQENARRVHEVWTNKWYQTFADGLYDGTTQPGSGNTYLNWHDSLRDSEGFGSFNMWLRGGAGAKSWGETLLSNPDVPLTATAASGWEYEVTANPWGAGYIVSWWTTDPDKYIRPGGEFLGTFSFTADVYEDLNADDSIAGDPGAQAGVPYRIWFGDTQFNIGDSNVPALVFDNQGWQSRLPNYGTFAQTPAGDAGFEAVLTLTPTPEPATICLLGLGGLALLRRKRGYGA